MSLEEASEALQLNKDQVVALVKNGALRGFMDQKTYKFRKADVDSYKSRVATDGTLVLDQDSGVMDALSPEEVTDIQLPADEVEKSDTSKIDLADIEGEAGSDESDQTSVLAPTDEGDEIPLQEETPALEFSEEDLGLALEDEDVADSILVADESESSIDILETAEESSSGTVTSATDIAVDEGTSSEEVAAVAGIEETPHGAGQVLESIDLEESSDEGLETIDLDEVAEAAAPSLEEAPMEGLGAETVELADLAEMDEEDVPVTETVETPVEAEPETVGISPEDDTALAEKALVEGVAPETDEVEEPEIITAEETEVEGVPMVRGDWGLVVSWLPGNILLAAAMAVVMLGGMVVFCEMLGIDNQITKQIADFVNQQFPNK